MRCQLMVMGIVLFIFMNMFQIVSASDNEWLMYNKDVNNSGYSSSDAPDTNNILWTYDSSGRISTSPAVSDGKIYFHSQTYEGITQCFCLDAYTGDFIWNFSANDRVHSSPAIFNSKVYFGEHDYFLYCLDADTGEEIWHFEHDGGIVEPITIENGNVYFHGSYYSGNSYLFCYDAESGEENWRSKINYFNYGSAVVNGKIYCGSNSKLYCVNKINGDIIWDKNYDVTSSITYYNEKIFFGSGNIIVCLNANTGDELWSYPVGWPTSGPVVAYGNVYSNGMMHDTKLYCFNSETGEIIWESDGTYFYFPVVADNKLYVGSYRNGFWCLDALTGEVIWRYNVEDQNLNTFEKSSAIAYMNLYAAGRDGKMYCFGDVSVNQAQDSKEQLEDGQITPGFEIILVLLAIALFLFWRKKK